jgi:hypothetical protein
MAARPYLQMPAKRPCRRYADGTELRQAIQSSVIAVKNDTESALILQNEKESLELKLQEEQAKTYRLQKEIAQLKQTSTPNNSQPVIAPVTNSSAKRSSMSLLIGIGFLFTCAGALAGHYLFNSGKADARTIPQDTIANSNTANVEPSEPKHLTTEKNKTAETVKKPVAKAESLAVHKKAKKDSVKKAVKKNPPKPQNQVPVNTGKGSDVGKVFTLFTTYAYFHSRPDEASKRAANINQWNNARLKALDDQNGFIYVVYTNEQGQTSRGWLRKKDLLVVGQ